MKQEGQLVTGTLMTLLARSTKKGRSWGLFRCACGVEVERAFHDVQAHKARSCGCMRREATRKKFTISHHIGEAIGDGNTYIGDAPSKGGRRYGTFKCRCGSEFTSMLTHVRTGRVKSCGCIARGPGSAQSTGHGEIMGGYWCRVKKAAAVRSIPFNLSIEDAWEIFLEQKRECRFSGTLLVMYASSEAARTASLDRIDSKKGYTRDNVQWVHKDINVMKQSFSDEHFIRVCHEVAKRCR